MARRIGEDQTAAHIGNKTDAAFGHGNHRTLGDDPVRTMCRNADTTAHGDAIHQRHIRNGEIGEFRIQSVLIGPEPAPETKFASLAGGVEIGDVATGAEGTIPFGIDHT